MQNIGIAGPMWDSQKRYTWTIAAIQGAGFKQVSSYNKLSEDISRHNASIKRLVMMCQSNVMSTFLIKFETGRANVVGRDRS